MIKSCPTCSRTYSDESISFCLADGALLSAPLESERSQAPPTEMLPAASVEIPTTETAKATPTMTSLPGQYDYLPNEKSLGARTAQSRAPVLIAIVVIACALLGGMILIIGYRLRNRARVAVTAPDTSTGQLTPETLPTSAPSATDNPSNSAGSPKPTASAAARSTPTPATSVAASSPATVQSNPQSPSASPPMAGPTAYPAPTAAYIDYNRVFTQREIDTKPVILSRPKPQYTEAARQNQVQGTVVLLAVLSAEGTVTEVKVIRGLPYGLSENAIAAARQMKFTPAVKDGHNVSVSVQIEYNFSLY